MEADDVAMVEPPGEEDFLGGELDEVPSRPSPCGAAAIELSPEDLPCDVCRGGSWDDDNAILICDGACNRAVHQTCYGVLAIPEGDWHCDRCRAGFSGPCFLCRRSGGIMRQASRGEWIHVLCALTLPGVHFSNVTCMDPVVFDDAAKLEGSRRNKCYLCSDGKGGCTLRCTTASCRQSFHPTCAADAGLRLDLRAGTADVPFFCSLHQQALRSQTQRDDGFFVDDVVGLLDGMGVCNAPEPPPEGEEGAEERGTGVDLSDTGPVGAKAMSVPNACTAGKMPTRDGVILRRAILPESFKTAAEEGTDRRVGSSGDDALFLDGAATARCATAAWRSAFARHDAIMRAMAAVCPGGSGGEPSLRAPPPRLDCGDLVALDAEAVDLWGSNQPRWRNVARWFDPVAGSRLAATLETTGQPPLQASGVAVAARGAPYLEGLVMSDCESDDSGAPRSATHTLGGQTTPMTAPQSRKRLRESASEPQSSGGEPVARFCFGLQIPPAAQAQLRGFHARVASSAWWRELVGFGTAASVLRLTLEPCGSDVESQQGGMDSAGRVAPLAPPSVPASLEVLAAAEDEAEALEGLLWDAAIEEPPPSTAARAAGDDRGADVSGQAAAALRAMLPLVNVRLLDSVTCGTRAPAAVRGQRPADVGEVDEVGNELWVAEQALERVTSAVRVRSAALHSGWMRGLEADAAAMRREIELTVWTGLYCVLYGPCGECEGAKPTVSARANPQQRRHCQHLRLRLEALRSEAEAALMRHRVTFSAPLSPVGLSDGGGPRSASAGAAVSASVLLSSWAAWATSWAPAAHANAAGASIPAPFRVPPHLAGTVLDMLRHISARHALGMPPSSAANPRTSVPGQPPAQRRRWRTGPRSESKPGRRFPGDGVAAAAPTAPSLSASAERWLMARVEWASACRADALMSMRAGMGAALRALADSQPAAEPGGDTGGAGEVSLQLLQAPEVSNRPTRTALRTAARIASALIDQANFRAATTVGSDGVLRQALLFPLLLTSDASTTLTVASAPLPSLLPAIAEHGNFVRRLRAQRLAELSAAAAAPLTFDGDSVIPLPLPPGAAASASAPPASSAVYEVGLVLDYLTLRVETAHAQVEQVTAAAASAAPMAVCAATGLVAAAVARLTPSALLAGDAEATALLSEYTAAGGAGRADLAGRRALSAATRWAPLDPEIAALLARAPPFGPGVDEGTMIGIAEAVRWLQEQLRLRDAPRPSASGDASEPELPDDVAAVRVQAILKGLEEHPAKVRNDPVTGDQLFCVCKTPQQSDRCYVGCDCCSDWLHTECAGLTPFHAYFTVLSFVCKRCVTRFGRRSFVRVAGDPVLAAAEAAMRAAPLSAAQRALFFGAFRLRAVVPVPAWPLPASLGEGAAAEAHVSDDAELLGSSPWRFVRLRLTPVHPAVVAAGGQPEGFAFRGGSYAWCSVVYPRGAAEADEQ